MMRMLLLRCKKEGVDGDEEEHTGNVMSIVLGEREKKGIVKEECTP